MKNYAIHYSYRGIGDVVIILFDNKKKPTHHVEKGRVSVIYSGDEVIGYNIFNIKDIIKIRNEGMIYLPSPQLIEVINTILINAGVEPLEVLDNSGYFVGQITLVDQITNEKFFVEVQLKDEKVSSIIKKKLSVLDRVVVAKVGTHLFNGDIVKQGEIDGKVINGHICTNKELAIEDNDEILIVDEDIEIGKDFFTTEVM